MSHLRREHTLARRALVGIPGTDRFRGDAQWVGWKCGSPPSASPCLRFGSHPSDPTLCSGPSTAFRVVLDVPLCFFLRVFSRECLNAFQKEGGKPGVSLKVYSSLRSPSRGTGSLTPRASHIARSRDGLVGPPWLRCRVPSPAHLLPTECGRERRRRSVAPSVRCSLERGWWTVSPAAQFKRLLYTAPNWMARGFS